MQNHQIGCRSPCCCLNSWPISRIRRLEGHAQHTLFLCLGLFLTLRITFLGCSLYARCFQPSHVLVHMAAWQDVYPLDHTLIGTAPGFH